MAERVARNDVFGGGCEEGDVLNKKNSRHGITVSAVFLCLLQSVRYHMGLNGFDVTITSLMHP